MRAAGKALIVLVFISTFSFIPAQVSPLWDNTGAQNLICEALAADTPVVPKDADEPADAETESISDPLEGMNRAFFTFNDKFYFWVLKPGCTLYAAYFPPGVRTSVRNAFANFHFPIRFVNNLLQGKFKGAGIELARFTINSTMGCGGLFEVANKDFNLPAQNEDFGRTLGHWGVSHGFYVVWPFLGPSSLRDTFGLAGDSAADPATWIVPELWQDATIKSGNVMNNTSLKIGEYEDFKKSAIDPYVSMREAYIQYRAKDGIDD